MKQRIVINVPISEEESRKKSMKIASDTGGVTKVEVVKERNHLVVVGEGIDSVKLVNSLRKKFCFANILTVHNNTTATVEDGRRYGEDEPPLPLLLPPPPRFRYDIQPPYYMPAPFY